MPVLPGYRYVGPGNKLYAGKPRNPTDKAARKHDFAYTRLLDLGQKPYTNWSQADRDFLNEISGNKDYGAYVSKGFFSVKHFLAKQGFIGTIDQNMPKFKQAAGKRKPTHAMIGKLQRKRKLNNQRNNEAPLVPVNPHQEEDEQDELDIVPETQEVAMVENDMEEDGVPDGKNDIHGAASGGTAMITNSGRGIISKEIYSFTRTRKWKFDTFAPSFSKESTAFKPNNIYPAANLLTKYDWHILPNNNLALYWSASDMAQIFGRPGLVRWRPHNLRIKVYGSRMAFDQPQNTTSITSIDRPIWISYVDHNALFMNQGTEAETSSVTGLANTLYGPPLANIAGNWSINPKADLHEYTGMFDAASGRTLGPVPLTTPLSLFRLRDWSPGIQLREDSANVATVGTSPESVLVSMVTASTETVIPNYYKELESIGDWQMHEPGSTFEWQYEPKCPPINVVVPGYVDIFNNTNVSHMPGAINLTALSATGPAQQFNIQNNIDYACWNTGEVIHRIDSENYLHPQIVESRMQLPVILFKIPPQTNSAGGTIAARCDFYATYEMDVECEYKTYATSRGAERNVVRNSRVVMNGGTLDQFDIINYPHSGPTVGFLKNSAGFNANRPCGVPRLVPGTI